MSQDTDERGPLLSQTDRDNLYGTTGNESEVKSPFSSQIQTPASVEIKVYKRRWYIMFVFGMMSMNQCAIWNTFSPISSVGERVFGWNTADLSLLSNWGPIAYVVGTFFFSWLVDVKGLRPACLLSAFLATVGTGLRCITSEPSVASPLIHLGQFLNGLGGPMAMGGPPSVSTAWFPPEQRTTATAIATIANTLGLAVSFLLGPYLVPDKKITPHGNSTLPPPHNSSTSMDIDSYLEMSTVPVIHNTTVQPEYDIAAETDAVMRYMYYMFGFSVLCLLLFFTYFPSKPPLPPSPTASIERLDFKSGIKKLFRNRTFWLICYTYGLALGIQGVWAGVLDVNLKDHGISQTTAAWLGFYGVVTGCAAAFVVARGADLFAKHLKFFLVVLFILSGCSYLAFSLALIDVIPGTSAVIYSTYILASIFIGATTPLFFESACEVTYPVAEGITNLVLTLVNNIAGLFFLLIQMIPNIGTMWENWCLVGGIFLCVPVLLFLKDTYNRLDIDLEVEVEVKQEKS